MGWVVAVGPHKEKEKPKEFEMVFNKIKNFWKKVTAWPLDGDFRETVGREVADFMEKSGPTVADEQVAAKPTEEYVSVYPEETPAERKAKLQKLSGNFWNGEFCEKFRENDASGDDFVVEEEAPKSEILLDKNKNQVENVETIINQNNEEPMEINLNDNKFEQVESSGVENDDKENYSDDENVVIVEDTEQENVDSDDVVEDADKENCSSEERVAEDKSKKAGKGAGLFALLKTPGAKKKAAIAACAVGGAAALFFGGRASKNSGTEQESDSPVKVAEMPVQASDNENVLVLSKEDLADLISEGIKKANQPVVDGLENANKGIDEIKGTTTEINKTTKETNTVVKENNTIVKETKKTVESTKKTVESIKDDTECIAEHICNDKAPAAPRGNNGGGRNNNPVKPAPQVVHDTVYVEKPCPEVKPAEEDCKCEYVGYTDYRGVIHYIKSR